MVSRMSIIFNNDAETDLSESALEEKGESESIPANIV